MKSLIKVFKFLKPFSLHYKKKDLLKIHAFYSAEIKINKKKDKKIKNINVFPKKLSNADLSKVLPFPPEKPKRSRRLTKYQILSNILPFCDTASISRRQYAFRNYAGTY